MMKKLFAIILTVAAVATAWAGDKAVVFQPGVDMGASYVIKDGVKIQMYGMNNPSYYEQAPGGTGGANTFTVVTYNHLIKSIEFTCIGADTEDYGPGLITSFTNQTNKTGANMGTYSYSGHEGRWGDGLTQSITFYVETGRIVRFGEIKVTYFKDNGDIYDLVISHDDLIEDGKYVIVSQQYDKAMSSVGTLYNGEVTAYDKQSEAVEWLNDDKTKVRVNDDTQVITLKDVSQYNSTNIRANYSIVDGMLYLRNTSNSIVNTATPYYMFTWLNTTNNHNAIIRGGAASGSMAIRYDATEDMFTFKDYNNSSLERVYLYKQAQNYDVTTVVEPQDAGAVTYTAGVVEIEGQDKSQQYENVAFTIEPNEGYKLVEVTVTDANGAPVDCTPLRGAGYTFVMPASDVVVTAQFNDALTAVSQLDAAKAVQSVTYTDMQGRVSSKPFVGVNIVVTRYSDGTTATSKVIKL